jgi:7-keto-8-aminopelargonate synthetase-like enzyme
MDYKDLERKLKDCGHYNRRFFVTEGIFSMEGNIPDLVETLRICKKYNCELILDDCHGVGILGNTGRGALEYWGIDINDILLLTSTMAKSIGAGGGGYVAGKFEVVRFLNQRSRAYIFSSYLCVPVVAVARYCLKYIREHPEVLADTKKKIQYFKEGVKRIGFEYGGHKDSAVVPVYMKCEAIGKYMVEELARRGVLMIGIAFPVVEIGKGRARVIIQRNHTYEQLDKVLKTCQDIATEYGYYDYLDNLEKGIDPFKPLVYKFGITNYIKSWFVPIDIFGKKIID